MEKRTPHCKLFVVHALVKAGKVRVTRSAMVGASELGFELEGMLDAVSALVPLMSTQIPPLMATSNSST